MILANIFNNGSSTWIILLLLIVWSVIWAYRTYKSQQSGSTQTTGYGKDATTTNYDDMPITKNANFWFLVIGDILLIIFLIWINADYKG